MWARDMRALGFVRGPEGEGVRGARVGHERIRGETDGAGEGEIIWDGGVEGRKPGWGVGVLGTTVRVGIGIGVIFDVRGRLSTKF